MWRSMGQKTNFGIQPGSRIPSKCEKKPAAGAAGNILLNYMEVSMAVYSGEKSFSML